jgi:hypothetical protein
MKPMHEEMMAKLDAHHERLMACLGKTEAMDFEGNPKKIQPEVVHQKAPKEEATAKSSQALKKWHRGRYLATGCRCQLKERTKGNCGPWKKWLQLAER